MSGSKGKTVVLVTGASGFLASNLIKHLTDSGKYHVRGTVRDIQNKEKTAHLVALFPQLELFEADLLSEGSFDKAVDGCEVVFHTASPFQVLNIKDPQTELIDPALKGTENVLFAVEKASSVKKVILTSSVAAIARGKNDDHVYTEVDWNEESSLNKEPYPYSKVLAEKRAWELQKGNKWTLDTVCPSFILGSPLSSRIDAYSVKFIKNFLEGKVQQSAAAPAFGVVHVDDVCKVHVAVAEQAVSKGERFMVTSNNTFAGQDFQKALVDSKLFGHLSLDKNTFVEPSKRPKLDAAKSRGLIGDFIDPNVAIVDMAKALVLNKLV